MEIQKPAVWDARIVQEENPAYAVEKGSLSITGTPYNAIASSSSQITFQVPVPSTSVFVSRDFIWSSNVFFSFTATNPAPVAVGSYHWVWGVDGAVCSFPLNRLLATLQATINDATVVINSADVINEVLRLANQKKNRLQRTCPTMLDKYQRYSDAIGSVNNTLAGIQDATDFDNVPNGAWANLAFTNELGVVLPPNGVAGAAGVMANMTYDTDANGVPVGRNAGAITAANTIYCRLFSAERLVLSPFLFSEENDDSTGLFGVQSIQLLMTLQSASVAKLVRAVSLSAGGNTTATNVQLVSSQSGSPFSSTQVNVLYLTPSLARPLPEKSIVPFMEFPRYVQTSSTAISAVYMAGGHMIAGQTQIQSQSLSLPYIPDYLVVYCKVNANTDAGSADSYLPISNVSLNWNNFAGLLSSHSREQLYQMSVENGLDMDYNTWRGAGRFASSAPPLASRDVALVGGFLVIKPGKNFALQDGEACGVLGRYLLQITATVNNFGANATTGQSLYIMTVGSGFLESANGQSRVLKGILSEQDVLSATGDATSNVRRLVGAGFFDTISNLFSKAKSIYQATKPIGSAIKGVLSGINHPVAQGAHGLLSNLGYGKKRGGASIGGAYMGAGAMERVE